MRTGEIRTDIVSDVQTLICYTSNSNAYMKWLERGRPADSPDDVPFWLPDQAREGDRYLLFVGGLDQAFVGRGKVHSNWRRPTSGNWKGTWWVQTTDSMFRTPVPADDVFVASGFKPPKAAKVVDPAIAVMVWKAALGKPLTNVERALEGTVTESRSKYRHPGLRAAALARAGGRCEACGKHFGKLAGGLGNRCLVVHHKNQLRDTDQPVETKLSQLAVVCANCHMMLHANPMKAMTTAQLRARLVSGG